MSINKNTISVADLAVLAAAVSKGSMEGLAALLNGTTTAAPVAQQQPAAPATKAPKAKRVVVPHKDEEIKVGDRKVVIRTYDLLADGSNKGMNVEIRLLGADGKQQGRIPFVTPEKVAAVVAEAKAGKVDLLEAKIAELKAEKAKGKEEAPVTTKTEETKPASEEETNIDDLAAMIAEAKDEQI